MAKRNARPERAAEVPLAEQNAMRIKRLEERLGNQAWNHFDKPLGAECAAPATPPLLLGTGAGNSATAQRIIGPVNPPAGSAYEGHISKYMAELAHLQDYCHSRLDELTKKLEPVLAPPNPEKEVATPSAPALCGFGDTLSTRVNVHNQINYRINKLIERLAL